MPAFALKSEEHTSELQSPQNLVCRLLLEKKRIQVCDSSMRGRLEQPARRGKRARILLALDVVIINITIGAFEEIPLIRLFLFFLMIRRPPKSTFFPYPTLFA